MLDNGEPCWNDTSMDNLDAQTGEPLETGHVIQPRPGDNGEPDLGYVSDILYFITDGDFIKIGRTNNLANRLKWIQNGNPRRLSVLKHVENSGWEEPLWHSAFGDFRVLGEWFSPAEPLLDAIAAADADCDDWCYFAPRPENPPPNLFPDVSGEALDHILATFSDGDHEMWGDYLSIRRESLFRKLFRQEPKDAKHGKTDRRP